MPRPELCGAPGDAQTDPNTRRGSRCERPALTDRRWRRQEMILGLSALRNDRSREQEATSATKDAITLDNLNVKAKKYYDQVTPALAGWLAGR